MFLLIAALAGGTFLRNTTLLKWENYQERVSSSDEFKSLAKLINYTKNEGIMLANRDPIPIACIEWVDYEPVSRKDMMLDVMKNVQLKQCSSSAISAVNKKYANLITDPHVMCLMFGVVLPRLEEKR